MLPAYLISTIQHAKTKQDGVDSAFEVLRQDGDIKDAQARQYVHTIADSFWGKQPESTLAIN